MGFTFDSSTIRNLFTELSSCHEMSEMRNKSEDEANTNKTIDYNTEIKTKIN